MAKDVCPLPGASQNRPLPLLLSPQNQIEDDLLNGGTCPTWRSWKSSFCGKACPTQASCACWCNCWGLNFLPQYLQTNTWPLCCQVLCWLGFKSHWHYSTPALNKLIDPKKRMKKHIHKFFVCHRDKHFLAFFDKFCWKSTYKTMSWWVIFP